MKVVSILSTFFIGFGAISCGNSEQTSSNRTGTELSTVETQDEGFGLVTSTQGFYSQLELKQNITYESDNGRRYISFGNNGKARMPLGLSAYSISFDCVGNKTNKVVISAFGIPTTFKECDFIEITIPHRPGIEVNNYIQIAGSNFRLENIKLIELDNAPNNNANTEQEIIVSSTRGFYNQLELRQNINYESSDGRRFIAFNSSGKARMPLGLAGYSVSFDCVGSSSTKVIISAFGIPTTFKDCGSSIDITIPDRPGIQVKNYIQIAGSNFEIENIKLEELP